MEGGKLYQIRAIRSVKKRRLTFTRLTFNKTLYGLSPSPYDRYCVGGTLSLTQSILYGLSLVGAVTYHFVV